MNDAVKFSYFAASSLSDDRWLCPNELNAKCPIVYFDGNDTLDAEEFIEILQNIYQKSIA